MGPVSRGKNEARQLVHKWLEGRGGVCPFLRRLEYLSKRQPVSTERGWQPFRKGASHNNDMPPPWAMKGWMGEKSLASDSLHATTIFFLFFIIIIIIFFFLRDFIFKETRFGEASVVSYLFHEIPEASSNTVQDTMKMENFYTIVFNIKIR